MRFDTYLTISTVLAVGLFLLNPAWTLAHSENTGSGNNHIQSLTEGLQGILSSHNAQNIQQLDCEKITDQEWENLGEAVMGEMHPDPTEHEAMDKMMGGEGSESLRQAHVRMGQNYLGCFTNRGVMSMMSSGIMDSWGAGSGILGLIFWLVVIVALVAITRYFWTKGNAAKEQAGNSVL